MSLPPSYWLDQIRAELARAKERVESACDSCPFRACRECKYQPEGEK